jgi:hypothetical protein
MNPWSGLGVNFANIGTASYANALAQLTIVRRYTNKVRIHLPDYQDATTLAQDQDLCRAAVALGFSKILWGVSSNRYNNPARLITQRNWPTFRQALIDQAAVAAQIGVTDYQIGNEEELHIYAVPATTSSMARASNVVTVTLSTSPDWQVGDTIYVEQSVDSSFNGTFTIASKNGAVVTWSQTGSNGSTTDAKITDFTKAALRSNLRGTVASVKAAFSGTVSTSVADDDYAGWVSDADMGSFDMLGYNPYGQNSLDTFTTRVAALCAAFPGKIKVTEFAMHSSWSLTRVKGIGPAAAGFDEQYRYAIVDRINAMRAQGVAEAYLFTWHTSDDGYAVQLFNGGYRSLLQLFTGPGRQNNVVVDS